MLMGVLGGWDQPFGATLSEGGVITRLMSSPLTMEDYASIARLQARRLQGHSLEHHNTTVLNLVTKFSLSSEGLGLIVKEIALQLSDIAWQPKVATHIPGIDNAIPDIQSRLAEPRAKQSLPEHLRQMTVERSPMRDLDFFFTVHAIS
eukprot:812096-Amphidinium_carterae.1